MTAEVAILNASGVALAADSAVTIGRKVYNSVNKLFTLSKHHPVGIMVYNSANVMTFPIETVVKYFRAELKDRSFDTLDEYCEEFKRFLREEPLMLSHEARENDYMGKVASVLNPLQPEAKRIVVEGTRDGSPGNDIRMRVEELIRQKSDEIDALPFVEGFGQKELDHMTGVLEPKLDDIVRDAVELYPIREESRRGLLRIAASLYVKQTESDDYTGIVIAGFGTREFMPRLRCFHFFGSSFGVSRIEDQRKCDIDGKKKAAGIFGFAQSDMVDTFTGGMGPYVSYIASRAIDEKVDEMKKGLPETMDERERNAIVAGLDGIAEAIKEHVGTKLGDHSFFDHYWPTLLTIQSMPKEDLARMAESLVSLTSLKRRATGKLETVGGPIDVALITKGDGFVFTQRKHYFDPNLNPSFVQNYLRTE